MISATDVRRLLASFGIEPIDIAVNSGRKDQRGTASITVWFSSEGEAGRFHDAIKAAPCRVSFSPTLDGQWAVGMMPS